jgi:hypothetical protein
LQKATGINSSVCAGKAVNFVRGLGAARFVRAQFRQKRMIVEVEMFWIREGKVLDEPREEGGRLTLSQGPSNLAIFVRRKRFSAEVKSLFVDRHFSLSSLLFSSPDLI